MTKLTAEHAIDLLQMNRSIHEEVQKDVDFYLQYKHPSGHDRINGGLHFIQKNTLFLQAPSDDLSLGGFLIDYGHVTCCYINSSQPRINQHFILFHEIYHLLKGIQSGQAHFVSIEQTGISLEERKADYFASLLLMPEQEMRNFFATIQGDALAVQIYKAMNQFKAPYKSILIRMLELKIALTPDKFIELFDDNNNLSERFSKAGLDKGIVEPSRVLNIPNLDAVINENRLNEFMPTSTNEKNKQLFEQIVRHFQVKGDH